MVSTWLRRQRASLVVIAVAFNLLQSTSFQPRRHPSATAVVGATAAAVGHQLGAQMSPRVVQTQYGKLRGVLTAVPVSFPDETSADAPDVPGGGLVESYLGLQYGTLLDGQPRSTPRSHSP